MRIKLLFILLLTTATSQLYAAGEVELKTTIIKGNNEAPQIFYMVPWQETSNIKTRKVKEQRLILHSLFGDLFDPILPEMLDSDTQSSSKLR